MIYSELNTHQQLTYNPLWVLSLCLPKTDCTKLLSHIVQHYDLIVQPDDTWVYDNYHTLKGKAFMDEPDEAGLQKKEFIHQTYTQLLNKHDSQEHHFFVSIRVTIKNANELTAANPGVLKLTQQFCEKVQRVMVCEINPTTSLWPPINKLLEQMNDKFAAYPEYQFEIAAYRIYGNGDTLNINGFSQGKQVVYAFTACGGNVLNTNHNGTASTFSGVVERGCHIAVINYDLYQKWGKNLIGKVHAKMPQLPRIIASQFIPTKLIDTHIECSRENEEQKKLLEKHTIKQIAACLFDNLNTQGAYKLNFFSTNKTFTLSRLRAIAAESLAEYLFYLKLEYDALYDKTNVIAKSLANAITLGETLMDQACKNQPMEKLSLDKPTEFHPVKRSLLTALLNQTHKIETSAGYWFTQCTEYYDGCDKYGRIAQLATNNYLLDQVYQCPTDDDLNTIVTLINTLQAEKWPKAFKSYLNDLNQLIETSRQTYLANAAI